MMIFRYTTVPTLFVLFFSTLVSGQPCVDGFSGVYPCDKVDQLSSISIEAFGIMQQNEQEANDIWGFTSPWTGREYALVGLFDRTAFVDVSSPTHPLFLGYLPTATTGILWRDIKVIGHWAYIVAEAPGHGLQIFDLRRLESLSHAEIPVVFDADAHYNGFGSAHNIVADTASQYVYAVGSNTFGGGLHIVDVSNPLNPQYAGSSDEDGYTHDAQVLTYTGPDAQYQGRQICFASNELAVTIFDVTDKLDVALISRTEYDDVGYTHQCWLTEDQRFLLVNDELDESVFQINTRTIIFNVEDLDNPFVVAYVDLGTTSIDHNLYTHNGLVYLSNYTSGVRIRSLIDVAGGTLPGVAFYDLYPDGDPRLFRGSWSNYPYFESGILVATGIYTGLHVLAPRLFETERQLIPVCGSNAATLLFNVNIPIDAEVSYSVAFESGPSPLIFLEASSSHGAPFQNAAVFAGLNGLPPGYYPGEIVIAYEGQEQRLPFALSLTGDLDVPEPVLIAPLDGVVLSSQNVLFQWNDLLPGHAVIELSPDPDFDEIVYQKELFSNQNELLVNVPFGETFYYWRLLKPNPCGQAAVSVNGAFEVGVVSSTDHVKSINNNLLVFPNPAHDMLTVVAPQGVKSLDVYDVTGRKITTWTHTGAAGKVAFDVSSLPRGMYVARDEQQGHIVRFVLE